LLYVDMVDMVVFKWFSFWFLFSFLFFLEVFFVVSVCLFVLVVLEGF